MIVALNGWTNTSWDTAANGGIYRPGVEQAYDDQLTRLRESEPTIQLDSSSPPLAVMTAILFAIIVACIIFFPTFLAAISS